MIELVGSASIGYDAKDLSGLTDVLADGTPHDRLGGFGSAIAWTGAGERYVAMVDRGPSDGAVAYKCRFHLFDIHVAPGATPSVSVKLVATRMLVDEKGVTFLGLAPESDTPETRHYPRLDPEGVRASRQGTLFLCEEYGPSVCEFDLQGRRMRTLRMPELGIPSPVGAKVTIASTGRGRVTNKGFEGLAITADGSKLFALLQGSLLQDHGRDGRNCLLVEIPIGAHRSRELCVPLDAQGLTFNEILAIDDTEFLAIERDGEIGAAARVKRIVKLDIAGASEVSAIASLPASGVPAGVRAVRKTRFLDLLDPRFRLAGEDFPEKIEGLTFGPDLPDGRRLLIVTNDNDFKAGVPSWIWAFAIDRAALTGFQAQLFDGQR